VNVCACDRVGTETVPLQESSVAWLSNLAKEENMTFCDLNGISSSWALTAKGQQFTESTTHIVFIKTHTLITEYRYETFHHNFLGRFSVLIQSGATAGGDEISFNFSGFGLSCSLVDYSINRLDVTSEFSEIKYWSAYDTEAITSRVEHKMDLALNGLVYEEAIEVTLNDYLVDYPELAIVSFIYAKEEGLVAFRLKNALTYTKVE
jgi:hypothetical protein